MNKRATTPIPIRNRSIRFQNEDNNCPEKLIKVKATYTHTKVCSPPSPPATGDDDDDEENEDETCEEDDDDEDDDEESCSGDDASTTTEEGDAATDTDHTETSTQTDKHIFPEYYYVPPPPEFAFGFGQQKEKKFGGKLDPDDDANANIRRYSSGGFDFNSSKDFLKSSYEDLMKMLNAANNNQFGGGSKNEITTYKAGDAASSDSEQPKLNLKDKDKDNADKDKEVTFTKKLKKHVTNKDKDKKFHRRQTGFPGKLHKSIQEMMEEDDEEEASPVISETNKSAKSSGVASGKSGQTESTGGKASSKAGSSKGSSKMGSEKGSKTGAGKSTSPSESSTKPAKEEPQPRKGSKEESRKGSKDGSRKGSKDATPPSTPPPEEQKGEGEKKDGEGNDCPPDQQGVGASASKNCNCVPGCIQAQLINCFQTQQCCCTPCTPPPSCCGVERRNRCCPTKYAKSTCCKCCHPQTPYFRPCACQQCRVYHYCYNVLNRSQIKAEDMFLGINLFERELRKRDIIEEGLNQQSAQPYLKGPIPYNNIDPCEIPPDSQGAAQAPQENQNPSPNEGDMASKAKNWQEAPEGYKDASGQGNNNAGGSRRGSGTPWYQSCEPPCRINPWQTEYTAQFKDHSDNMRRTNSRYPYYDGGCCGGGRDGC